MKQGSQGLLLSLLFAFLLLSQSASARFLAPKQGEQTQMLRNETARADSWAESFQDLMGATEQCEENEEEEKCLKRRMIEEAHLDYVYTQNQKP